jgi:protease I
MQPDLKSERVAFLVTNGFEEAELMEPKRALELAGAKVDIVSLKKSKVRAWNHSEWGDEFDVDVHIADANPADYSALVLPGGVMNPDYLRMDERAVAFVRKFAESGRLVAAICHGAWTLIEADLVHCRRMTSFPSLKTDLKHAGAIWIDADVVVDSNLLTSRRPDDLPAFCGALVRLLSEEQQSASVPHNRHESR